MCLQRAHWQHNVAAIFVDARLHGGADTRSTTEKVLQNAIGLPPHGLFLSASGRQLLLAVQLDR